MAKVLDIRADRYRLGVILTVDTLCTHGSTLGSGMRDRMTTPSRSPPRLNSPLPFRAGGVSSRGTPTAETHRISSNHSSAQNGAHGRS
jgi:hypothetical protein